MTTIKVRMGTLLLDLHVVDTEDMDRLLASPGARARGTPVYIDHSNRMYPIPAQEIDLEPYDPPPPHPDEAE